MKDDSAILYGQLQTSLDVIGLSNALEEAGIASRVGESSHYESGLYLRIARAQAELTFESIGGTEFLVSGEAPSGAEMNDLARSVSDVLGELGSRHRFEIYLWSEPAQMIGYFHCDWPLDEPLA